MKILITGGLGFIGSNFIRYILVKHPNHEIVNIDKIGIGANSENLKDLKNESRYQFVKADISKPQSFDGLLDGCDVVVNFAAETHVDRSIYNPQPFVDSNFLGTYSLLECERKLDENVRHIQISTDETYGEILEGSCKEDVRLNPSNPYSATKAAADLLCQAYKRTYNLDIIITRSTNNFGPYQFLEKLIPKTVICALKDMKIPVYGTGGNVRDWLYVLDHCEAIDTLIEKGKSGEIYNISSGNEISVIKIVKQILEVLDKPEKLMDFVEDRPGHDVRYSLNSSKIRSNMGWKPKHAFKEALEKTVDWYVENDWWWRPLMDKKVLHPTPWKL